MKYDQGGLKAIGSVILLSVAMLCGCVVSPTHEAPVVDRSRAEAQSPAPAAKAAEPAAAPARVAHQGLYDVQAGDTLYSIALSFGQDPRDIARWNGLDDRARLRPGQALRVAPPSEEDIVPAEAVPVAPPPSGVIEARPLGPEPMAPSSALPPLALAPTASPAPAAASGSQQRPPAPEAAAPPSMYPAPPPSPAAALPATSAAPAPTSAAPPAILPAPPSASVAPAAPSEGSPAPGAPPFAANVPAPLAAAPTALAPDRPGAAGLANLGPWTWPGSGPLLQRFDKQTAGIDLGGSVGDPIVAANDGQVVYVGSGLRGWGKLVIIKHTDDFISAYGHNKEVLVTQGQAVKRGQRIAELGMTDAPSPRLHFEIRRRGLPVDPLTYLPSR